MKSKKPEVREPIRQLLDSKQEERVFTSRDVELRTSDDGSLLFSGYATTFDSEYEMLGGPPYGYTESVNPGAFTKTLSDGADVRLLINHDGLPLARSKSGTLSLSQDAVGLRVEAKLDPNDPDVQRLMPKMARGDLNEMSFAFRTIRQEWNDDYTRRNLSELSLQGGDVSIVTFPANPATSADLRSLLLLTDRMANAPEGVLAEMRSAGEDPRELVRRAHKGLARLAMASRAPSANVDVDLDEDPGAVAQAIDAALDAALDACMTGDNAQCQALILAAELASDALLDLLGVVDADDVEADAEPAYASYLGQVMANRPHRLLLARNQLDVLRLRAGAK